MSTLQQLNIQYHPEEDRLKLKIRFGDDNEVALWLTQRYVRLLLSTLNNTHRGDDNDQAPTTPTPRSTEAQKAVMQFQREVATKDNDYETDYRAGDSHPLGEAAILAIKVEYTVLKTGMMRLGMGMQNGQTLHINLDQKTLHTLTHIILMGTQKAGWDLGDGLSSAQQSVVKTEIQSLH